MHWSKVHAFVSIALMASPVQGQSNYPMPIQRDSYNDWVVECFEPNDLGQECQIYQRLLLNDGSAIAMVATMAYDPSDTSLLMQFALPLGINIENGVVINIDEDIELSVPISRCTKQGCIFEGVATPGLRDALIEGKTASITVVDPTSQPFVIPLSLSGFGDALDQIQSEAIGTVPLSENIASSSDDNISEGQAVDAGQAGEGDASTSLEAKPLLPQVSADSEQEALSEESDILDLTKETETDDTLRPVTGTSE
ncbi:hypothetical protein HKX24_16570 [Sulfitobacter sp. M85]|nr:hypothetical protein [Sulfitobacter sp. Ks11]MDF3388086.1 hypothetical protein [Sulfitobacter sp. M85]MDF3391506.1 hypothetical protein [Sulfitobacter sp. Ks16]MDF3402073.1 hypothetical protein [Sulfitobacter sp. KE39]MDF3405565.1 hypothetical protein [Sulfitobacter sp. Ks35]MDF3412572.1 hypothetical protein [Sulfitobacter sp. KE38]